MRFASVSEMKNRLSEYLSAAHRSGEAVLVTHHGKPYALIHPVEEGDLEVLEWRDFSRRKLARAWDDDEDALYDYL